ncbi:MAG: xylulokinase [Anaerolineales bacterium]|nr:xylulokinase [Anaerolineales bacterium]
MNYLLGIDLGTTGLKVSLFTEDGILIGSQSCEYPLLTPQAGYVEQDPQAWWGGFTKAAQRLKQAFPEPFERISGIGLCGQMHTQVYLDKDDRLLRPAITWMDQRSSEIVARIQADQAAWELIYQETANYPSTTYTALQVKWVQENQPEIWRQTRTILVAKDYLKYRLTGVKATDFAEASGTLLFDVRNEHWSAAAYDYFGIPMDLFPTVGPSDDVIGLVTRQASLETGIKEGTPVVNGSSDNAASALGAGMARSGQVTLIIGTAGVVSVCSDRPLLDRAGRTLCWHYCLPQHWITLGITQTAGESLEWFKNAFDSQEDSQASSGDIFNRYNQAVSQVPDGSGGVIFLPYLNGERTPYWDSAARGVFFGLNLATQKAHFIKAIMEGVCFALRNNIETIEALGIQISEVRAVGGGLKSPVWLETLGKILRKPVATVNTPDTANLGNILLCGKALGIINSYQEAVERMVACEQVVHIPEGVAVYEKQYPLFLELYPQLRDVYRKALS